MTRDEQERQQDEGGTLLRRPGFWMTLIPLLAAGVYLRTLGFGWVYEDRGEVVENTFVHSLGAVFSIFSNTAWAGSGTETYLYRPVLIISYALNHLISGLDPWSYHLGNVLLFAGISVLVFRLARLLGFSAGAAGLSGILFVLHPLHVEVVAPVFGRRDLLAVFFVLAMVLLHQKDANRGGWRLGLPVGAFALALLSKEIAIVGVAFVALYDWIVVRRKEDLFKDQGRGRLYIGYLVVLLAYHAVRIRVTGGVGVPPASPLENPLVDASIWVQLGTAVVVIGKGMLLHLAPLVQSPDYSFDVIPLVESLRDPRLWATLASLAVLVAWLWKRRHRDHVFTLLGLWYLAALLPTSNLLAQVGTIFAERFLFLPSVAFCLAAGGVGAWALRRFSGVSIPVLSLWLAGLFFQTLHYTGFWEDDISLFSEAVRRVPASTKAHHQLGAALVTAGSLGEALPHLRQSLSIAPENRHAAATLARARMQIRERYLPPDPSGPSREPPPENAEILHTLGTFSRERGDMAGAERYWEAALGVDSLHAQSLADLGSLKLVQGDPVGALEELRMAVALDPSLPSAWFNLGQLHLAEGREREAVRALEAFLEAAGPRYSRLVEWARDTLAVLKEY